MHYRAATPRAVGETTDCRNRDGRTPQRMEMVLEGL